MDPVVIFGCLFCDFQICRAKWTYDGVLCGPVMKLDGPVVDGKLEDFAHGFPKGSDLVMARSRLNGHELSGVKPRSSKPLNTVRA